MSDTPETEVLNDQPAATEEVVETPGSDNPSEEKPATPSDDKPTEPSEEDFTANPFEEASDKKEVVKEESPSGNQFDKDLDTWAVNAGHDKPENDRERKLLQNIRNGSRDFTRQQQAKKSKTEFDSAAEEIEKDIPAEEDDTIDPLERDIKELKADRDRERATRLQSEFFTEKAVSDSTGKLMGEILKEKVDKAPVGSKKQVLDYWSHPDQLPDLHELATARELQARGTVDAEEAARKERERVEKESKNNVPSKNAQTTDAKPAKDPTDPDIFWD